MFAWPIGVSKSHVFLLKENREPYSGLWGFAVLGPLHSLLQPLAVWDSLRTELPLIALPQTPRLTLKLSWLKPHPGSIPGLDSPAALCRWSNTSLRWPSVCAARSPPKPEPQPHPHPTARPRPQPGLLAPASQIRRDLPLSIFHLPNALARALVAKTKVCMKAMGREEAQIE